jgi:hypothetical protein
MCPQTSYSINIPAASYPGQFADDTQIKDVLTGKCVASAMPYGLLAVVDTTNTADFANLAVKLPYSSASITTPPGAVGVVVADQARAQNPNVAAAVYPQYSAASIGRKGRFWVQAETAVADGAKVYARWQTGDNGTVVGAFGGILDTSVVGNALLPNAVWRGTYASAGFAVLELDLV